ncbi:MAG: autotransporter-associated beta strand repeat-containing protein [Rariglobus sp.]|nr:autotransporter-associated beta strand repeat-containing protein [Rariglobus sp.]
MTPHTLISASNQTNRPFPKLVAIAFAAMFGAVAIPSAQAASLYWDIDDGNIGGSTSTNAPGNWDASTASWNVNSDGSGSNTTYVGGSDAFFSASTDVTGSSAVVVTGSISANSITIEEGSVTLSGASTPVLTIGAGGMAVGGTGRLLTASSLSSMQLSASQTWTNNSTNLSASAFNTGTTTAISGVSGTGGLTLTLDGTNNNSSFSSLVRGVISNGTGNTLSLAKSGTGLWTLSGNNTYTGTTTVSDGTLALGAADRIANTSNLVMAGGTFATGGFNETLGTLTLSANSTIDMGSLTSALVFADSHSIAWSGTLTLLNFDIGTDTLKFGSSISALTLAQLNSISLAGYTASLDASGFVTFAAVPEPSTYAAFAGMMILGFAAYRRRIST